jgi:hypothetical protein
MALATIQIFGEYRVCQDNDIPRPCRDTGPPHKAGFVFSGFRILQQARIAPSARVGLFAIPVNAPASHLSMILVASGGLGWKFLPRYAAGGSV